MSGGILPVIGSSGFYELGAPFESAAVNQVEYTCMALRRISDYLANNEEVKETIYTANAIPDDIWEEDSKANAYIVSLQSKMGHWLYVPARYILGYPSVNGIQYRSMMIGVALPALPVAQDLTAVTRDIKDLVESLLGVNVSVKLVETSKVTQVENSTHELTQQRRAMAKGAASTLSSKNHALELQNAELTTKLKALEDYIKANHI